MTARGKRDLKYIPKIGDETIIDGRRYTFLETQPGNSRWHSPEDLEKYKKLIKDNQHRIRGGKPQDQPAQQADEPPQATDDELSSAITRSAVHELSIEKANQPQPEEKSNMKT